MKKKLDSLIINVNPHFSPYTKEDIKEVATEYAKFVLDEAYDFVEGEIVFANLKAESEFNAMIDYDKFKEGVDYKVKLNKQDILELKKNNMKKGYKEIKNFFHNELNISKEEVRKLMKEAIRAETTAQTKRILQSETGSNHFENILKTVVKNTVEDILKSKGYNSSRDKITKMISEVVASQIEIKLK